METLVQGGELGQHFGFGFRLLRAGAEGDCACVGVDDAFAPGDRILLKRGCAWQGAGFKAHGNGSVQSPITLADSTGCSAMYSAVAERGREIATMRALGFRSGTVIWSFMFESILIASVGGAIGCGPIRAVDRHVTLRAAARKTRAAASMRS